jgi:hypothetical protein
MNKVSQIIGNMEKPNFPFKPQKDFYTSLGINRKRFWAIFRNETQPKLDELNAIADYFKVNIKELI